MDYEFWILNLDLFMFGYKFGFLKTGQVCSNYVGARQTLCNISQSL
jgi:hypothetical protein